MLYGQHKPVMQRALLFHFFMCLVWRMSGLSVCASLAVFCHCCCCCHTMTSVLLISTSQPQQMVYFQNVTKVPAVVQTGKFRCRFTYYLKEFHRYILQI